MKKVVKLLWIDDMEEWSGSAVRNLEIIAKKHDINLLVIHAKNGEEYSASWNIIQNYDFDCILMDYKMEPYNGDKYIQEIRDEDHLFCIPIIFYSQDNSTNLDELVKDYDNVTTVFRGYLIDKIKEMFFD